LLDGAGDGPNAANKRSVLESVARQDILHFACHGIFGLDVAGGAGLDSGLVLSDGAEAPELAEVARATPTQRARWLLSAREILGLTLRTDLVTLRACSSGRVEIDTGGELFGLLRAFLYAGAPTVIASLWNVNKRSSEELLTEFYMAWIGGGGKTSKVAALQQAQAVLRKGQYPHPYHWAAFAVVADWF
jgi:CHAT domain-containing protein